MKGMNFTMPVRVITSAVLACSLMFFAVSCSNPPDFSVSGSASVNLQTGAPTLTGTATWTWKHQPLQKFALFAPPPLSGASLASLDPTQAILTYSLTNATIASTGGTVTVTVADGTTGTTIGQQEFAYDVRGNSLFAHDPAAVSSWLQEFSAYSLVDVTMTANTAMTTTSPGTASFTSNAVYQGVTYASVSASWTSNPIGGGGGCHTRICPNQ